MDLEPDESQAQLRDEVRRFLAARVTPEARRAAAERPGAVDRALWSDLAEMGTFTLPLPEAAGGVGLGWADAALVVDELGRAAVPGPLVGTALAATLAPDALPAANGTAPAVGVVDAVDGPALVEHLAGLDALVVLDADAVRILEGDELAVVLAGATALDRPLDPLTPVHRVARLDGGRALGDRAAAAAWRRTGGLLVAALQVGLGDGSVAMATAYAGQRRQFGREIGSFQAVKHLLADAYAGVEVARSAVWSAAVQLDEALAEGDVGASVDRAVAGARVVAASASVTAAKTCIQVHGGMGFTWELDAHLYLKRALALDTTFGSVESAVAVMAASL